jgi:hypothetical protein
MHKLVRDLSHPGSTLMRPLHASIPGSARQSLDFQENSHVNCPSSITNFESYGTFLRSVIILYLVSFQEIALFLGIRTMFPW